MQRQSNFELLRIVAMLMVLVLHANYFSLGIPSSQDVSAHPMTELTRIFAESVCIVAVNAFVLISGWFGITPRFRRLAAFMFQVAFFAVFGSIVAMILGHYGWNRPAGGWLVILLGWNYWYVKAYIILYIFSPMLNAFVNQANRQQLLRLIVVFFLVQTIYGWYLGDGGYFNRGYSPLSMMGLYLLARYLRLYGDRLLKLSWGTFFLLYIATSLMIAILDLLEIQRGTEWHILVYSNPIVIISSVFLFMAFVKIDIGKIRVVNFIAPSAFAAYLFQGHEDICHTFYTAYIENWYVNCTIPVFLLHTIGWILALFCAAIVIDQIRKLLWFVFEKFYCMLNNKLY